LCRLFPPELYMRSAGFPVDGREADYEALLAA
jgi:hypothetical protein